MNAKEKVTREALTALYNEQGKPMHRVADILGVSVGTVFNYCKKYGIETRPQKETFTYKGRKLTPEQRERISKLHKGKVVSLETRALQSMRKKGRRKRSDYEFGGHEKKRSDGYVAVYIPDHPRAASGGYVMKHILVMETIIGRHLKDNECVHHINHIRDDNNPKNLKLMTLSEHASLHARERNKKRRLEV